MASDEHPTLIEQCEQIESTLRVQDAPEVVREDAEGKPKCSKFAGSMHPRLGMSYVCVLDAGHDGECQRGGTCFKHGPYVGAACPEWPTCAHDGGRSVYAETVPAAKPLSPDSPKEKPLRSPASVEGDSFEAWWDRCLRAKTLYNDYREMAQEAWNAALRTRPASEWLPMPTDAEIELIAQAQAKEEFAVRCILESFCNMRNHDTSRTRPEVEAKVWISVIDGLPEFGEKVLVADTEKTYTAARVSMAGPTLWVWAVKDLNDWASKTSFVHWQKISAPPIETRTKESNRER